MNTLVLTGLPGSGKTVTAQIASRVTELPVVDVASVLRDVLEQEGVHDVSRGRIGVEFVARHGRGAVLAALIQHLAAEEQPVILDAVRLPETLAGLRQLCEADILFVACSPEERLARLKRRLGRAGQGLEAELDAYGAFDSEEAALVAESDVLIRNDGSVADLERAVREALTALAQGEHTFYDERRVTQARGVTFPRGSDGIDSGAVRPTSYDPERLPSRPRGRLLRRISS